MLEMATSTGVARLPLVVHAPRSFICSRLTAKLRVRKVVLGLAHDALVLGMIVLSKEIDNSPRCLGKRSRFSEDFVPHSHGTKFEVSSNTGTTLLDALRMGLIDVTCEYQARGKPEEPNL